MISLAVGVGCLEKTRFLIPLATLQNMCLPHTVLKTIVEVMGQASTWLYVGLVTCKLGMIVSPICYLGVLGSLRAE